MESQGTTAVAEGKARIYLFDRDASVRRGMELLIRTRPDLMVCGEALDAEQALAEVSSLQPDLAIVDLRRSEKGDLELLEQLRGCCPALRILVFSAQEGASVVQAAFRAGADGYIAKDEGAERLLEAIERLLAGRRYPE